MSFKPSLDDRFYHVFNKSISNYNIFSSPDNSVRFLRALVYYNGNQKANCGLGTHLARHQGEPFLNPIEEAGHSLIKILCYTVMPDHYHLVIRVQNEEHASLFISLVENSYTRYFNIKHNRKGPLWQNRFKKVVIASSEQLLHVTRYVHLNSTTSGLVTLPENWEFSSYRRYIEDLATLRYMSEISIRRPALYRRFVENNIDYQRKLKLISKHLI